MLYLFQSLFLLFNNNNSYYIIEYNSILLVLLTLFIFSLVKLLNNSIYLLFHKWCLIILFLVKNIFIFYVFYELSVIPLIFYLLKYNYKYYRITSIQKLLIYTIIGSFTFIISLILIYYNIGTFDYTLYQIYNTNEIIDWFLLISFLIKVPVYPLHNWLPLLHSEANTIGSVILASILLKIGIYGILTYINISNLTIINLLLSFSLLSIIYSIYYIFKSYDLKKIIANTSIIHMNYTMFAIMSNNNYTLMSSYYSIISHGLISSMLFLIIGIIYNQTKSRNYLHISGLSNIAPYLSIIFFISFISNNGIPLTSAFITELLTFLSLFQYNPILLIIIISTIFFNTLYTFNIINKVIFQPVYIKIKDININDIFTLTPLIIFNFIFSLFPYWITIIW